jgi:hypothetical protein
MKEDAVIKVAPDFDHYGICGDSIKPCTGRFDFLLKSTFLKWFAAAIL